MKHETWHYPTPESLRAKLGALGLTLPWRDSAAALAEPLTISGKRIPNRIALQPMEGSDGAPDRTGVSPGALTRRKYLRFAGGGAGLLWFEAVAICPEGKASPRQLEMTGDNVGEFARLLDDMREAALKASGFAPPVIVQATHSGRYARPQGQPTPLIAYNNPLFEGDSPLPAERIVSDDYLRRLEARYGAFAALAEKAGFDGIDIKCCHRYLGSELLSAYAREGDYGGPLENRSRFLRNAAKAARAATSGGFLITSRLNAYDGFPYPYGFGVAPGGGLEPDLSEAIQLAGALRDEAGVGLLNITIGNPYMNPHVNRPYDRGNYVPDEHPLEGVARMMRCVGAVQKAHPDIAVLGSGFSYLRHLSPHLAAGAVEDGVCALAGFGRMAIANPSFPREALEDGSLAPEKCCAACGKCAELLRGQRYAGCVLRDEEYARIYREFRKEAEA